MCVFVVQEGEHQVRPGPGDGLGPRHLPQTGGHDQGRAHGARPELRHEGQEGAQVSTRQISKRKGEETDG